MATLLSDDSFGTLSIGLAAGDTTLNFTTGHGARFPAVTAPDVLYCCILNTSNVLEEIKVTAHTINSDSCTIVRAQGGTTAKVWNAGDRVEARLSSTSLFSINVASATTATSAGTADHVLVSVSSSATGFTQTAFDNTARMATCQYAQSVGLKMSGSVQYTANDTLSVGDAGKLVYLNGAAFTLNIQLISSYPIGVGQAHAFSNIGTGAVTLSFAGGTGLYINGSSVSTFILQPGDSLSMSIITASSWSAFGVYQATQYTTSVTPIPAAGVSITQSHSMGDSKFNAKLQFTCITTEQGYLVDDVMQITRTSDAIGQVSIWQNSTQVGAPLSPSSAVYLARSKDGATSFTPTTTSWSYRFMLTR